MRIRLPLLSTVLAPEPRNPSGARRAVASAIAISDAVRAERALSFAASLAIALAERSAAARLCLLAYDETPPLPEPLRARLERAGVRASAHRVASAGGEPDPVLPELGASLPLLVGAPSFGSFVARLSILTGTERPLREWPAWLAAARRGCSLELLGAPDAVARALASELTARDFLPREDPSVR